MLSRLRKLLAYADPAPRRSQFQSLEQWIRSWVEHRVFYANGNPAQVLHLGGEPAIYVFGSLGLDTAIDRSGRFWIATYELHEDAAPNWRSATAQESSWIAVCATRRNPELSALIPPRPAHAIPCEACGGTGFVYNDVVICEACSALGWLPADGT
jgi:hypothetical protein